jgi:hypothetical protein
LHSVYAPYWMLNHTGLTLRFASEGDVRALSPEQVIAVRVVIACCVTVVCVAIANTVC